jgi:hypothetical protein
MKLTLCLALVISLPVVANAELAGDWIGILSLPQRTVHLVLHVSGPDNALKATRDNPDQNIYGHSVSSIMFSGTTLQFAFKELGVTYTGDLNSNGSIAGTFSQNGGSFPLVLTRAAIPPQPPPTLNGPAGELRDGVCHHSASGVDLGVPAGWSVGEPRPALDDPNYAITLLDPEHRARSFIVDMRHFENLPEKLPASLSLALETLVERHEGKHGAQGTPGYKIREGSVEHTTISGLQALRATGEFERDGMKITELVTYIFTEHTRTEFTARVPSGNVEAFKPVFEQILQSARIP